MITDNKKIDIYDIAPSRISKISGRFKDEFLTDLDGAMQFGYTHKPKNWDKITKEGKAANPANWGFEGYTINDENTYIAPDGKLYQFFEGFTKDDWNDGIKRPISGYRTADLEGNCGMYFTVFDNEKEFRTIPVEYLLSLDKNTGKYLGYYQRGELEQSGEVSEFSRLTSIHSDNKEAREFLAKGYEENSDLPFNFKMKSAKLEFERTKRRVITSSVESKINMDDRIDYLKAGYRELNPKKTRLSSAFDTPKWLIDELSKKHDSASQGK